jgi:hypothetical protein
VAGKCRARKSRFRFANVSLQHGVPLAALVKSWIDSKFQPGMTGEYPDIKTYSSMMNLVGKLLACSADGQQAAFSDYGATITQCVYLLLKMRLSWETSMPPPHPVRFHPPPAVSFPVSPGTGRVPLTPDLAS